jgi:hypothetical protein
MQAFVRETIIVHPRLKCRGENMLEPKQNATVQCQLPAHHTRVRGKPPVPKAVAQQHRGRSGILSLTFLRRKRSSDDGFHSQ